MTAQPRVSVLTATYNGERFLAQAIESILAQTWRDFEYILVDDASQDRTPEILARYAALDDRIVRVRCESNLGPNRALNRALETARGEFVAILDHDDLAMPERLAKQVEFLEAHPQVSVVGSAVIRIGAEGEELSRFSMPLEPNKIRWDMLFGASVQHSAACMRRALVMQVGGYSRQHRYATDYELYSRLIRQSEIANLPDFLVCYRANEAQTSRAYWRIQRGEVLLLLYAMYKQRLGIQVRLEELDSVYCAFRGSASDNPASVIPAASLLELMYRRYLEVEAPDEAMRDYIRRNCAFTLVKLAHANRETLGECYAELLERASRIDSEVLTRPKVLELLNK